jgi:hypothetical protein
LASLNTVAILYEDFGDHTTFRRLHCFGEGLRDQTPLSHDNKITLGQGRPHEEASH